MSIQEWGPAWVTAVFGIIVTVLNTYLSERSKQAAREQVEKTLAEQRHQQEKALATFNAEVQKRLQEYSLFTQKQHAVYARLFRLYRDAAEQYITIDKRLRQVPRFGQGDKESAREYLVGLKLERQQIKAVMDLFDSFQFARAFEMIASFKVFAERRDADAAFRKANKHSALYELYLSDPVSSVSKELRGNLRQLALDETKTMNKGVVQENRTALLSEHSETVKKGLARLRKIIRSEMLTDGGQTIPITRSAAHQSQTT